jgi:hypothetical protein
MKVPDCPKNLKRCPEDSCPIHPCWAFIKHSDRLEKEQLEKDDGWE